MTKYFIIAPIDSSSRQWEVWKTTMEYQLIEEAYLATQDSDKSSVSLINLFRTAEEAAKYAQKANQGIEADVF